MDDRSPGAWARLRAEVAGRRADAIVALIAFGISLTSAAASSTQDGEPSLTVMAVVVLAVGTLVLAFARQAPVLVWLLAGVAAAVYGAQEWPDPLVPLGPLLALAFVFELCARPVKVGAWLVSAVAASISLVASNDSDALDWWIIAFILLLAPVLGEYLRTRRLLVEELEERAHRVDEDRRRAVHDARVAERTRVARELHDVVAHHVTMMVVQAEAAASVPTMSDSARQEACDELAKSGREALAELRRMLGILRSDDQEVLTAPQPGLERVDDLLATVRAAGVDVDLTVTGERRPLPAAVDLAAYRVVQEALTNVVKHSGVDAARLTIAYHDTDVAVVVEDDGSRVGAEAGGASSDGGGVGLTGLRERVALLGGTLSAGPQPLGGFRLEASLPLERL
jgi:signal transduction histidine kinase